MSVKLLEDSKVLSIRVSSAVMEELKLEAYRQGLTPSVFVRTMLYAQFNKSE